MCSYFDDLGIDNHYEYQLKQDWITKNEYMIIQHWHELLDKYNAPTNDDYDVEAIIADQIWEMIATEGQKAKVELSKSISDEEIKILFEEIEYN